jgi:hypothetical protein
MAQLSIHMLGELAVQHDGHAVALPASKRSRIHVDPAHRLVVVVSSAWPEATARSRSAALTEFLALVKAALDGGGS